MNGDQFAVPEVLRSARFVPRQAPGRREPARVTRGAFTARGLPVPEDRRQWNSYQLSRRRGFQWSPPIDAHVQRRGAELIGGDQFVCVDCDTPLAVDGSIWMDGMRRLADLAAESGSVLDLAGCIPVRTPGHDSHAPGWHLWWRAPDCPVRLGPLSRCPLIEIKNRCTAPASPGYPVRSVPDGELDALPGWLAKLAGAPRAIVTRGRGAGGRSAGERLEGVIEFLLEAGPVIAATPGCTGRAAGSPRWSRQAGLTPWQRDRCSSARPRRTAMLPSTAPRPRRPRSPPGCARR